MNLSIKRDLMINTRVSAFSLFLAILTLSGCLFPPATQAPPYTGTDPKPSERTVFIEMQPWYGNPVDGPSDGWYHWGLNGHDPADGAFLSANGKRDVAARYYPLIGAYDSRDAGVIAWQIEICKAMLVDCIMIDWYGDGRSPDSAEFRHYGEVTDRIIRQAESARMKAVLLYETQVQKDSPAVARAVLADLESIIGNTAWTNSPAYLHRNGIPVICVFGAGRLRHYEWASVKKAIGARACLVADCQPYRYENPYRDNTAFDGCFEWDLYNDRLKSSANPDLAAVRSWANGLNDDCGWWAGRGEGRFAISIIWPGFDDTAVNGWGGGPRVTNFFTNDRPGDNGSFYGATMEAALNSAWSNDWVLVATLNDWNESTAVEPSREKGYAYAIQTKRFAESFKGVPDNRKHPDSIIRTITESHGFTCE
jgi:glycoprotein endo-alpha-1,2-mannosidase